MPAALEELDPCCYHRCSCSLPYPPSRCRGALFTSCCYGYVFRNLLLASPCAWSWSTALPAARRELGAGMGWDHLPKGRHVPRERLYCEGLLSSSSPALLRRLRVAGSSSLRSPAAQRSTVPKDLPPLAVSLPMSTCSKERSGSRGHSDIHASMPVCSSWEGGMHTLPCPGHFRG